MKQFRVRRRAQVTPLKRGVNEKKAHQRKLKNTPSSSSPLPISMLQATSPGNTTPLQLTDYLDAVSATPFELIYVRNDRRNYLLTTRHWAENLDRHRDEIVARWGEQLYRRFRLYLWGCVHSFSNDDVTAYRLLLELPQTPRFTARPQAVASSKRGSRWLV